MSKKDFEALALALASVRPSEPSTIAQRDAWGSTVVAVSDVCQACGPRFDRNRFQLACAEWQTAIRDGKLVRDRSKER